MQLAMHHEGIEAVAYAIDLESFNAVWRPRGWELLEAPEAFASEQLGVLVTKVDDLTIAELYQLCALRRAELVEFKSAKVNHLKSYKATFDEAFEPVEPEPTPLPESLPAPQEPPAPAAGDEAATSAS